MTTAWRHRIRQHPWLTGAGLLLLTLVVLLWVFQWNWLRGPLERALTARLERQVAIGYLDVDLGWTPRIRLDRVRVANAEWGSRPQMLTAEQLNISVNLRSLLTDYKIIPHVDLRSPDISLERTQDGKTNWNLAKSDEPSKGQVEVRNLTVDKGQLQYLDALKDIRVYVQAATGHNEKLRIDPRQTLTTRYDFKGDYGKVPFSGIAFSQDVLSLQESGVPFALQTDFKLDTTRVAASGTVSNLLAPTAIDMQVEMIGDDLAELYPAIPVTLPESPPYRFNGRFQSEGDSYAYRDFTGKIGNSDIQGTAVYTAREPRPHLQANLRSKLLDLADLGPMIGLESSAKPSNTAAEASPQTRQARAKDAREAKRQAASESVLPKDPFSFERLNTMDANVRLRATQLRRPDALPLEDLDVTLVLAAGVLELKPLKTGFAGGTLLANLRLDSQQKPIAYRLDAVVRGMRLAQLFPTVDLMKDSTGRVGADIRLNGRGDSVATMLGAADGSMQMAMEGGDLSILLVEAIGLDGGEIIKYLVGGDRKTRIRCAATAFEVNKGQAASKALVVDTVDTLIEGEGAINFANEQFDVKLSPKPKDPSILSLRTPVRLHGSFGDPGYSLDKRGLALRGGAAIALGMLNPLAALIPLIETGPGEDSDCAQLLASSREAVNNSKKK